MIPEGMNVSTVSWPEQRIRIIFKAQRDGVAVRSEVKYQERIILCFIVHDRDRPINIKMRMEMRSVGSFP